MDNEEQAQQNQYASAAGRTESFGQPTAASDPAAATAPPARSVPIPKLRGIKWRWVLAGVAALVVAGAAFAAWSYFNAPQRIVGQAFSKLAEAKTMKFNASATSQLKGLDDFAGSDEGSNHEPTFNETEEDDNPGTSVTGVPVAKAAEDSEKEEHNSKEGSPIDVTVGAKGVTDVSDPENVKTAATVTLAGKVAKVTMLSLGIEVKSIGTTGYFRLNDFTDASSFGTGDILKPLKGQWVKVDEQDVSEATAAESGETPEEPLKLPDREKVKQLTAAADKSKLITFRRLPDDSIDGQPADHFGYTIDKQHLEAFIPQASQIISEKPLSEAETKEIADVFKSIDFNEGEIWIGQKDHLPHKITLGIKSNFDFLGDIILSLTMSDFDQPVTIDAPQDAKTFEELEKQLMQESFEPTGGSAGKDSDGDGHSDSEEIRSGFDPYGPGRQATQAPRTGTRDGYEY